MTGDKECIVSCLLMLIKKDYFPSMINQQKKWILWGFGCPWLLDRELRWLPFPFGIDGSNQEENEKKLKNCKSITFHCNNRRPHAFSTTSKKLLKSGWKVMPHPSYRRHFSPSGGQQYRMEETQLPKVKFYFGKIKFRCVLKNRNCFLTNPTF